ncbi:MAG: glycosyltransferase family 4 protein, partial [Desulfamplus sp.]|nr:glycosyltransferase family 4 protein [Desulfamplus sp.]
ESEVLHPAVLKEHFKQGNFEHYLFIPGRLHRWKRVDLLIESMKYLKDKTLKLIIAGRGEDEKTLKKQAAKLNNVEFAGRVSDQELISLYANCLAVPFLTKEEDYGYVTIEAFKSGKPVVTCRDSGEPAWFVENSGGGFVCAPDPKVIAEKFDSLALEHNLASKLGQMGLRAVQGITWENIAKTLLVRLFPKEYE